LPPNIFIKTILKNHRIFWYKIIAIFLPVVLLAMIEGVLRLCNYGYNTRLFLPKEDNNRILVMNRHISKKYFTIQENATVGNQDEFYRQKRRGSLRFFVLGASSSLGFPYMYNGAFPRMLKYRLQFEYPERTIEIINLSLTAINSYTLADFSKQLVDCQPDGVLIYAGHNEYYGALGVASTSRLGRNPVMIHAVLKAKNLKIVQCIAQITASLKKTNQQLTDPNLTLMQRMSVGKEVDAHSAAFFDGIKQFDYNMQHILRVFQKNQIPVFIGTLVSNLGDQKPLGKSETAQNEFDAGKEAFLNGDYDRAGQHFLLAKEFDNLRFRAPEIMNEKIRGYANMFSNVHVVDVQNIFVKSSPHGITGKELLLEHVHPNLEGQRLIAGGFYDQLKKILPATDDTDILALIQPGDYPLTPFDSIYGDLYVRGLKTQWPFNEPSTGVYLLPNTLENKTATLVLENEIRWGDAMKQLYEGYMSRNDFEQALSIMEGMYLEFPNNPYFISQAAKLCMHLGKNKKACFYLTKEYEMTSAPDAAANLATTLLKLDMPVKALPYIDISLKCMTEKQNFNYLKNLTQQMIQIRKNLDADPENKALRKQVYDLYLKMGNMDAAAKYIDE